MIRSRAEARRKVIAFVLTLSLLAAPFGGLNLVSADAGELSGDGGQKIEESSGGEAEADAAQESVSGTEDTEAGQGEGGQTADPEPGVNGGVSSDIPEGSGGTGELDGNGMGDSGGTGDLSTPGAEGGTEQEDVMPTPGAADVTSGAVQTTSEAVDVTQEAVTVTPGALDSAEVVALTAILQELQASAVDLTSKSAVTAPETAAKIESAWNLYEGLSEESKAVFAEGFPDLLILMQHAKEALDSFQNEQCPDCLAFLGAEAVHGPAELCPCYYTEPICEIEGCQHFEGVWIEKKDPKGNSIEAYECTASEKGNKIPLADCIYANWYEKFGETSEYYGKYHESVTVTDGIPSYRMMPGTRAFAAAAAASLESQTIGGESQYNDLFKLTVDTYGQIKPYKKVNGAYTQYQYYGTDCNGEILKINNTVYGSYYFYDWGSVPYANLLMVESNVKSSDGRSITTTYKEKEGVQLIQTIEYPRNSNYLIWSWKIKNNSGIAKNVSLIYGGDTYFDGDDSGYCYYDNLTNMVYVKKDASSGIMALSGDPSTPANRFYSGYYADGKNQACQGMLQNYTSAQRNVDAGYFLQWDYNKALDSGKTWTVNATERFTDPGTIQIINPPQKTVANGSLASYRFLLQNLSTTSDQQVQLEAISADGFPISIRQTGGVSSNQVTVPRNSSKTVVVDCEIPESAENGLNTRITLNAYVNGKLVQGSASNTIIKEEQPTINRVVVVEKTDTSLKVHVTFENARDANSDGKIEVKAELLDAGGQLVQGKGQTKFVVIPGNSGSGSVDFEFPLAGLSEGATYYVKVNVEGVEDPNDAASIINTPANNVFAVSGIDIVPSNIYLSKNETVQLNTSITPSNASNKEVLWESSNPVDVSVDANGKITAKQASGSAVIRAYAKDLSGVVGTATVSIKAAPARIDLTPANKTIQVGEGLDLRASVMEPSGYKLSSDQIQWNIEGNQGNVGWTETGIVESGSADVLHLTGMAITAGEGIRITASVGNVSASALVRVGIAPEGIEMTSGTGVTATISSISLAKGQKQTIGAIILPEGASVQPDDVVWSVSNGSDVLELDNGTGLACGITAKNAGSGELIARIDKLNIIKRIPVTVHVPLESIKIIMPTSSKGDERVTAGQSLTLGLELNPIDASMKGFTWSVLSGPADISSSGQMTVNADAKANDTIKVKATVTDAGLRVFTTEKSITVKEKLTGLKITGPAIMKKGQTAVFTVIYDPANVEELQGVTWSIAGSASTTAAIAENSSSVSIKVNPDAVGNEFSIRAASTKDVTIEASLKVGITQAEAVYTLLYKDKEGNLISAVPKNGFYNQDVVIQLSGMTGGSIQLLNTAGQPSGGAIEMKDGRYTLTDEGSNSFSLYGIDGEGCQTAVKSDTVKIDKTPPTIADIGLKETLEELVTAPQSKRLLAMSDEDFTAQKQVAVTVAVNDALSGTARVEYRLSGAAIGSGDGEWKPMTVSGAGVYVTTIASAFTGKLQIKAVDHAGNEITKERENIVIKNSTSKPEFTMTKVNGGAAVSPGAWTSAKDGILVRITADADAKITYKAEGAAPSSFDAGTQGFGDYPSEGLTITAEGVTTITAIATDSAGNTASESVAVKLDHTKPDVTTELLKNGKVVNPAGDGTYFVGSPAQIRGTVADAAVSTASAIKSAEYQMGNGTAWTAMTPSEAGIYTVAIVENTNFSGVISLKLADEAGNETVTTMSAVITDGKVTPPAITLKSLSGGAPLESNVWTATSAAASITSSAVNLDYIKYRIVKAGEAAQDWSTSAAIQELKIEAGTEPTIATIEAVSVDKTGSESNAATAVVKIDGRTLAVPQTSFDESKWYDQAPVEVTASAILDQNGSPQTLQYRMGAEGAVWTSVSGISGTVSASVKVDTTTDVAFRVINTAGSTSAVLTKNVKINTAKILAPTLSAVAVNDAGVEGSYTSGTWAGRGVTVTAVTVAGIHGANEKLQYSTDSGTTWKDGVSAAVNASGEITASALKFRVYDTERSKGSDEVSFEVKIDSRAIATPKSIFVDSPWYDKDQTVTVSAVLDQTGSPQTLQYKVGSGDWISAASGSENPAIASVLIDTTTDVAFKVSNTAGNESPALIKQVKIDKAEIAAPTVSAVVTTGSGMAAYLSDTWAGSEVKVTATAAGMALKEHQRIEYSTNAGIGGQTPVWSEGASYSVMPIAASTVKETLYFRIYDTEKIKASQNVKFEVKIDQVKPAVGTIVLLPENGKFYLAASAIDKDSGIAKVQYKDAANAYKDLTNQNGTFKAEYSGSGIVTVQAIDAVGNVSDEKALYVTTDTKAPTAPAIKVAAGSSLDGWNKSDVVVTISAIEEDINGGQSGIKEIQYKLDKGTNWVTAAGVLVDGAWEASLTVSGDGVHSLYARVVDQAGNISAQSGATVKIDQTKPKEPKENVEISYITPFRQGAVIKLSNQGDLPGENASGIKEIRYTMDAAADVNSWTTGTSVSLTPGSDEFKGTGTDKVYSATVSAVAIDNAGNRSDVIKIPVELHMTPINMDVIKLAGTEGRDSWYRSDVSVKLNPDDITVSDQGAEETSGSGVKPENLDKVYYKLTGAQTSSSGSEVWVDCTTGLDLNVIKEGITNIQIKLTYKEGKAEDVSGVKQIKIDRTMPSFTYTLSDPNWIKAGSKTINLTVNTKDENGGINTSGIHEIRLGIDVSEGNQTAEIKDIEKNGEYAVIVTDNAGNMTKAAIRISNFDSDVPGKVLTGFDGSRWYNTAQEISGRIKQDGGSPLTIQYSLDGTAWKEAEQKMEYGTVRSTYLASMSQKLYFRAIDGVGNEGEPLELDVKIDANNPNLNDIVDRIDEVEQKIEDGKNKPGGLTPGEIEEIQKEIENIQKDKEQLTKEEQERLDQDSQEQLKELENWIEEAKKEENQKKADDLQGVINDLPTATTDKEIGQGGLDRPADMTEEAYKEALEDILKEAEKALDDYHDLPDSIKDLIGSDTDGKLLIDKVTDVINKIEEILQDLENQAGGGSGTTPGNIKVDAGTGTKVEGEIAENQTSFEAITLKVENVTKKLDLMEIAQDAVRGAGAAADNKVEILFDIKLVAVIGGSDVAVQPTGKIKVSMTIPTALRNRTNLAVYWIDDEGDGTNMNAERVGDAMVFETSHLSVYALTAGPKKDGGGDNPGGNTGGGGGGGGSAAVETPPTVVGPDSVNKDIAAVIDQIKKEEITVTNKDEIKKELLDIQEKYESLSAEEKSKVTDYDKVIEMLKTVAVLEGFDVTGKGFLKSDAASAQYISGYPDGTFRPGQGLSREEAAAMIYKIVDTKGVTGSYTGQEATWAKEQISALMGMNILKGETDGTFRPKDGITRAEFAIIAIKISGADVVSAGKSSFKDVNGRWMDQYVSAAYKAGYMKGDPDGKFRPEDKITRAECVTVLNKVLKKQIDVEGKTPFSDVPKQHWAYEQIMTAKSR